MCMCVCRFVEFATTRDVLNAIQEFNGYDVGRDKKLVVKVKEDRGKREERMAWINKERDFLNSLHATGELEELSVDKDVPDNPLEPRYILHHPISPEKPTPPAGESGGPSDASLGSSAGAASLKASPPRTGSEEIVSETSSKEQNNKGDRSKLPCHVCQIPTPKKCCNVPYCSPECQKKDWSVHKKTCSSKLSRGAAQAQKQPDSSPPVAKVEEKIFTIPGGPLAGFYVSVGGSDDFGDDSDLSADACVSLTPSKEEQSKVNLDSIQTASSNKVPCSDTKNGPEVDSTSSDSLFPYPSLLNRPPSASLHSQKQLSEDDDDNDDVLECQPKTPPGSPPLPGQSSDTPIQTPPPVQDSPREDIAPVVAIDRQNENSFKRSDTKYLSTQEILTVFDQCPTPLSSHPISEFPPAEFTGIVTSAHSPTQFHAVLATSHVREALVKLLDYGSSVTPMYCGLTDLNEGSLYGYTDDNGDFYRVELVYRSGAVVLYDMGLRFTVQTSCLFLLSEEIKSIPRLCFQMTLNKLYYEPDKKEDGREFLFSMLRGHPMAITNHSIRAYKSNVDISFILASVASLDNSIDVGDQVLKNGFAKMKKEDSSKSQSKDSVFRKKLDLSPSKVDSSLGKVFPTRSPTKGQWEKESDSGSGSGGAVAPVSQQTSGGSDSPPAKSSFLCSPPNVRKPMFIDGSPDKMGKLRNTISMNQNRDQSPEIRPQTPPTQKVQTPNGKSSVKYKLVQMSNKVPFHNPPVGVMFEMRPIVVFNPNIIWAQVIHSNMNNFKMMETDLNKVYGSRKNEPYAPAPGEMCAAKYPQDQKYYRVEVLCVNNSGTVDIQLVDYGHRDTVTMRQIHHLEPIFLSLPKQALQFSFVGIVPAGMANTWSDNAIAFLKEKILNRVVPVKVVMQTPATCMAEVWDPDEPMQLLNTSLVELGLAQEATMFGHFSGGGVGAGGDTSVALRGVSVTSRQDQPKTQSNTSQEQDQLPSLVSVTNVSSHSPRDSKQPLGGSASSPSPAKPMLHFNLPILLKPGDFEKPKPSATFNSPPSSLPSSAPHVEKSPGVLSSPFKFPKIESESQKSPSFSAESPIGSVSPKDGWSAKQSSASHTVSSSSSAGLMPTKVGGWSPKQPSSSSSVPTSNNTATTKDHSPTASRGRGWSPRPPNVQQEEPLKSSTGREQSLRAQRDRQPTSRNSQKPTIDTVQLEPNGNPIEAIMLYVENPLRFYIQVVKDESCDSYMKMANELNEVDLVPLTNPSNNDFCLCRFPTDGTIGRVKIFKVDDDCIHIQHIDYGNRKKVTLDALFKMDQRFACIPAQAIPCTLNQLLNPSGKNNPWTREAMDFFLDQVRSGSGSPDILMVMCVQVVRGSVHVVNVTTSAQKGGKDLLSLMVEAKLGGSAVIKFDKRSNQRSKQEEAPKERRPNQSSFSRSSSLNLIGSPIKQSTSSSEGGLPWTKISSDESATADTDSPFKKQAIKSPFSSRVSPSKDSPGKTLFKSPEMAAAAVAQTDSPFKKQTMKSPFSEAQSKISPPKDGPDKALFKSESAQASTKPSSSKRPSVLVSAMEKVLLPSKCDTLTLLVTEVSSPDELYVHTAESAGKSDELFASLSKHFSENKSQPFSQAPAQGSLVCAKFSQDGAWYRAEVLESSADGCRVRFIDYGNAEVVQLYNITECPAKFVSIPILASCCQLGGVAPPTGSTTWSDKATQLLKEATFGALIQAEVFNSSCSPPALKLSNKEGDLATELINRGLAAAPRSSPAVKFTPYTFPRVASLSKASLPSDSDSFIVLVSEACSPDELYIQTANFAEEIDELCSSLFSHFTSKESRPLAQPPSIGCLVCAKFSEDGVWYRGEVLETSGDSCHVRFIDFGNAEMVRLSDMTECPAEFVSIPILASCCQLGGVAPPTGSTKWSDEAIQLLKEATSGVPLQAMVVDSACSPPALKLINKEGVDLTTELVNRGLAAASGVSFASEENIKAISVTTYPRMASLPKVPLPSDCDNFTVLVTCVSSPAEFYVQTTNSAGIDELCTSLYNHFVSNKSQPLIQPPGVGYLVCGKFSQDGAWYRAEVLESSVDGCRVRFIDYGNAEVVQLCDITECPAEFVSIPILASCCQLGGVAPPTGSTKWSDGATQLLKEATSGVPLQAMIVNPSCSPPALKLTNSESVDLATVLINKGLAVASRPSKTSSSAKSTRASPDSICPKVSSLQKVSLPQENIFFFLIVTDVYSPDEFYIQTLEDSGAIDQLSELLNKHYRKNKPVLLTQPPATGSLVCAKFSQDDAWYRGEVLEASADCCRILFIDYGNTESVKLSDMAQCPQEFISTSYPRLASCCCLSGVAPPTDSTGWSDEATQLLISMASNGLSEGIILDKSTSPPSIKLKNDSFADFAAELVMKGLARRCATFPSSAMKHPPVPLYPKVSGMKKAELGSKSDYFTVIVSDVWSPEAFFIVSFNQNTQSLVEDLRNGLNSHFKAQPPSVLSQPPSQGSLVCAKYSQDGAWYRSEVLESYNDSCKLLFIDYGNIEVAKLEDMAPCPVKFTSLPIFATKCSLSGITPSAINEKDWSSEVIALFKQLTCGVINAKIVGDGCGGDTIPVELVDTSDSSDVNIASELISRVQLLAAKSTSVKAADAMFTDIPIAELPDGVPIKVRIVFVIDPNKFFVHNCEKSLISAFQEMGMTLQSTYNTSESNYRGFVPKIDALCCCQSLLTPDKSWYRCKVVGVSKKEAKIQSLDFGFTEKIPVDKLFYLDPKFVTLPAQAVPCYLSGVTPTSAFGWNNTAKAMFKSLLKEKMNAVAEKDKSLLDSRDGIGISLFTSNGNKSVASAFIESGYAAEDPFLSLMSKLSGQRSVPQNTSDEPKVPPIPIPHSPIPMTKSFPVILTHVESLSEFYLQVATKEKLEQFCELLRMVHEYAQTAKDFKSLPPLGTLCIAMHSDDSWYRAQVVKIIDRQRCSVFFFDFGNVGEVSLLKIKPITEEKLLSCPIQALKCGLYGASAIPSRKRVEVMNLFSTLVPLETVKNCHIVSKYPLLVDLECGSGCPTLSLRDELARNDCLPKPNDLGMLSLPTNKLSTDCKPVVLTEIKDPSDFWLQIIDKSVAHQFDLLTQEIHHYATGGAIQNLTPVLGQLCIAKYSEDDIWYRAKVIQVEKLDPHGDEYKVKVQFVDYGNEEIVDIDQLRPFQHHFKCLPAQAIHCSLVGFKVPAPKLAEEFRSLVEHKKLVAVKKDSVPGELCTSVELIDSSGDEDIYIHSKLSRP